MPKISTKVLNNLFFFTYPNCSFLLQFTDNGLIVMYNGEKEKYAYPRPTSGTTFGASLNDRVFVAPFYSDVNFSCDSTVYYQVLFKRVFYQYILLLYIISGFQRQKHISVLNAFVKSTRMTAILCQ